MRIAVNFVKTLTVLETLMGNAVKKKEDTLKTNWALPSQGRSDGKVKKY